MSFVADGFETIGNASGTISMDFDGEAIEMPYEATLYLNGDATIAAAETADPSGEAKYLFLSKCPGRDVLTGTGHSPNAVDVEGTLVNCLDSTDRDALLASHKQAADNPQADGAALSAEIAEAPSRWADLSMKLMAQLMAAFQE